MRLKKIICLFAAFVLVLPLIACTLKEDEKEPEPTQLTFGKFNENGVYINEWLGITFVLPEGLRAATADEMSAMSDGSTDVVISGAANADELMSEGNNGEYFDFALIDSDGVCSVRLNFEATALTSGSHLSAKNYLMNIKSQTELNRNYVYTIPELKNASIAGRDYYMLEVGISEYMTVRYYAADVDGILALFTVMEYEGQETSAKTFLNRVGPIN